MATTNAADIFRSVTQELAHAELALSVDNYNRGENSFRAYCVSYMLCKQYGFPTEQFSFDTLPGGVPLVKISGLLGHNSIHTTFEYYCDVMDEKGKIIAFMNDRFPAGRTETEE
ncbi:MAG: hypothetical protein BHW11_07425 [Clostridium sp. CAG:62_40_43]|jgi:hypothetical protein|nr:MAG: hypothetical protein BHW11_07425 [Clostridium sp. CAG:62_40_43]